MKRILDLIIEKPNWYQPDHLAALVDKIRPKRAEDHEEAIEQIQNLIAHLKSDPESRFALGNYLLGLFKHYDPVYAYTTAGILTNKGLINEFWSKLKHKFLPPAPEEWDMRALFREVFHKNDDYIWVINVPHALWIELMEILNVYSGFSTQKANFNVLNSAIQLLSHNIASIGLDYEITRQLPETDNSDSPFLLQNKVLTDLMSLAGEKENTDVKDQKFKTLAAHLDLCIAYIDALRQLRSSKGTSLHLIYLSRRLMQQIDRIKLLLHLYYHRSAQALYHNLIKLGCTLIKAENQSNSIKKLFNETSDLLAFEIVEHSAYKGGKYIANDLKEYLGYLKASILGGLIIAFFACFKVFIDKLDLSPLGEGLLLSINYSACFVLVYMLGGIIATKQPAMTASAVARSMDTSNDGAIDNLNGLKELIIKVSRSQFISFVGNLACAFPIAYLLAKSYGLIFNAPFTGGTKSAVLLAEINPVQSGAIFFACLAGIFLSLSGLISGYFDNKVVFSNIPERIRKHPGLKKSVSPARLAAFSNYIKKNMGVLAGNISLGFFLGMAGTIGIISGLPIDIRHVAFSSANFGFALEGSQGLLSLQIIMVSILGLLAIGLLNFLVSFGMTLFIAVKSRKITFVQTNELIKLLLYHFMHAPLDFFIQPGRWPIFKSFSALFKTRIWS